MEKVFQLSEFGGPHLWTRESARPIREKLEALLSTSAARDVIVLDCKGIDVFDYSFANELFGKILISLPREYPGRYLIVEHLTEYVRENLSSALESLSLVIIERKGRKLELLGKVHPIDEETFQAIVNYKKPVTAALLKDILDINITAINERLNKLTNMALFTRVKGASAAGREQYIYWAPFTQE